MNDAVSLTFAIDWEDPGGVRAPEFRATWARLEIWVGDQCITRVEDSSGAVRRGIYVPLYPLAEWVAFNWWSLTSDHRPSRLPTAERSASGAPRRSAEVDGWLTSHNLRSVGDGFPWPDVTIVPEGGASRVTWAKADLVADSGIRYLASGDSFVDAQVLVSQLTGLVESVLTRLAEQGLADTPLNEEWTSLQSLDEEERAFCEASARLGLDPFNMEPDRIEALLIAEAKVPKHLLGDFLDSVDLSRLVETAEWVQEVSASLREISAPPARLPELPVGLLRAPGASSRDPWRPGYEAAEVTRARLGLSVADKLSVEDFVHQVVREGGDGRLDGYGDLRGGTRLALARRTSAGAARFAAARALWHTLSDATDGSFLLTRTHTSVQKAERAFAAELLAPAAGIQEALSSVGWSYGLDDLEELAATYGVSTIVIERQIENRVTLSI